GLNPGFVISAQSGKYWKVNIGDGTNRLDIQGGNISTNEWHHIAVSFDRNGLMTAYEDGVVVGFEKMQNIGNINSGLPLTINQDGTTTYAHNFRGSYRDIRIWDTIIPQNILLDWSIFSLDNSHPFYSNLLTNWRCEDGVGSVLQDASTNNNDCNIQNQLVWQNNQTEIFTVYDYTATTRQPDNAVAVLDWLCIPIQAIWGLDGKSWLPSCNITTSINQLEEENSYTIGPNPTEGYVDIFFTKLNSTFDLSILDLQGKIMYSISHISPTEKYTVQLPQNMKKGIYFLKIQSGKSFFVEKMMCE
ncbi:MAG: DUF4983 domain-containing protein, partial [Flavobacteriales bacterium]|nr:DUF4983 domain-containing protein [Flavobacteriales bacterium]